MHFVVKILFKISFETLFTIQLSCSCLSIVENIFLNTFENIKLPKNEDLSRKDIRNENDVSHKI